MTCQRCTDLGQCCRYIELPLARGLSVDEGRWVELHPGVHMVDAQTIHLNVACSALTPDGLCELFGTDRRPAMCAQWPDDLAQVPQGCVYAERLALV